MINKMMTKTAMFMSIMFFLCGVTFSQTDSSSSNSPSNLLATADGNVVSLTWQAPTGESTVTYNIYRAMVPGTLSKDMDDKNMDPNSDSNQSVDPTKLDFSKISTATETSYEDKIEGVPEDGQTYIYYVVAVDNQGMESAGTNYVTVNVGVSKTQSMVQ